MTATTPKSMAPTKWALAIIAILTFAFCMVLAVGVAPAYAEGENGSEGPGGPASPQPVSEASSGEPNAPGTLDAEQGGESKPAAELGLEASSSTAYPGENPDQGAFLGLVPAEGFEYEVDENNVIHVYLESNVGKSLDLGVNLDYMRIGDNKYDAREGTVYIPLTDGAPEADGTMISWYNGDAPLPQGTFSTRVNQHSSQGPRPEIEEGYGVGALEGPAEDVQYDVTAFAFMFSFLADGETGWQYEISNRLIAHMINEDVIEGDPHDGTGTAKFALMLKPDYAYVFDAKYHANYLLFNKVGEYVYTAQATYVAQTVTDIMYPGTNDPYVDENGNTYQHVDYTVYASYPVVFHINVGEAPAANLLLSATDANGDVPLNSNFKIELSKQIEDGSYALCSTADSYEGATAGSYKLKVTSKYGTHEPKEITFSLSIDEIEEAGEVDPSITKTIELTAIPDPPQFTVVFADYDDSVLSTTQYNKNTLSEAVVVPTDLTKPEDDDYTYKFDGWETEQDGAMVRTGVLDVLSDKVYRAVYRAISKDVVSNSTIRVHATGGLFGKPKPEGVEKHELVVSQPDESEKVSLVRTYAGTIGNRTVDGVYVVDIIQHMTNGSSESLTEGVGEVVLTFPTTLAEGTLANVYQLHQLSNGGTVVIEHNNLMVVGGNIEVPLDGRLSTFIITTADEVKTSDPENGDKGTPAEGSGKDAVAQEKADKGEADASGDQDADDVAEPSTEGVKAASSAGDASMPATGDPLGALPFALAVLVFAAAAACVLRLHRDQ